VLDVLTAVVLVFIAVRVGSVTRRMFTTGPMRDRAVLIVRGIRLRHILPVPLVLAAVLAVASVLVLVPGLDWGWWSAIGGVGNPVTVSWPDGRKLEGKLVRRDDFLVILTLADGTRRSIARNDGVPAVEVKDPNEAHKKMVMALAFDDPENKHLHDVTAYLATLK